MLLFNMEDLDVKVINGRIPVLLSAPHVYSHRRPSLTLSYKWGEEFTDTIVEELCLKSGAWGIIQAKETDYDPNWHKIKENPYKKVIKKVVGDKKFNKFIDIHGLNDENKYDFGIYYPSRFRRSIVLAEKMRKALDKGELAGVNVCIFRCPDDLQETLAEYVADELRIPSVQLEVARYIRESDELRNEFIKNLIPFLKV